MALKVQKELLEAGKKMIEEPAETLAGVFGSENVSCEVHEGYVADRILEIAESWPADLIILGSHGKKGFTRFLLGSVSQSIVSHSPCSVEVVKLRKETEALNKQEK